ncbi:MAG: hypothetical protein Q9O74_08320 [Planctomycetota bacterium]|nr:hypothetical protein [Planctomycetota bacterium]
MTETEQTTGPTRTSLSGKWLSRMVFVIVGLIAFGSWGFYDAVVAYPNRGKSIAAYKQLQYLEATKRAGKMFNASIIDPAGELADLESRGVLELSEFDRTKREWLEALAVPGLGMLDAEHTRMDDPAGTLASLTERFKTEKLKKPLSGFDILTQWVICGVCWGLALYLIGLVLLVRSRIYRWDAATTTLTLPNGTKITPADLDAEDPADLSKWQKFIVFLRPREGHAELRGPVRFDVFRYTPLEDWLRVLIKAANPEIEFPDELKARLEAEAQAEQSAAQADEPSPAAGEQADDDRANPTP